MQVTIDGTAYTAPDDATAADLMEIAGIDPDSNVLVGNPDGTLRTAPIA